ncbi:MAG: membrane protein insertase YidC, partial [Pseudomonadota bacterium]
MSFDPNMTNPKQMHPKDKRNLILFVTLSILVWLSFEHFVIKPRLQKIEAAQSQLDAAAPVASQTTVAVDAADAIQPVAERLKETKRITIDTPELLGSLPLIGNRIDDISLKNYGIALHDTTPVTLMAPSGTLHPLYAELGWLSNDTTTKLPDKDSKWVVEGNATLTQTTPVKMMWSNGAGLTFARRFSVDAHFMISVPQTVSNTGKTSVELYPYT